MSTIRNEYAANEQMALAIEVPARKEAKHVAMVANVRIALPKQAPKPATLFARLLALI